jgi:cell division transport system permease protein
MTAQRRTRIDLRRWLEAWTSQHAQALLFSAGQMWRNPAGSLLATAVIGISLALPAAFYLALINMQQVAAGWGGSARITLFLNLDVPDDRGRELAERLRGDPDFESVQFVNRDEALAEYERLSGFAEAVRSLEENPLPAVILLQPRLERIAGADGDRLLAELRELPEVDAGQFDRQWVQRLFAILDMFERAATLAAALLALAVLLIVGNTIRLSIYNRRTEIEINKLFGATDAFIQRPFLYSGLLHGLGGALLAWALVTAATCLLAGPADRLAGLYFSSFELAGLRPRETITLLAAGGLLGLAGSFVALRRHLREFDPR